MDRLALPELPPWRYSGVPFTKGDPMRTRPLLILVLLVAGCTARDGDLLGQALQRAGQKLETAAGGNANQFAGRLRTTARPSIGLAERVETRLKWDRFLDDVEVVVESPEPGVVKVKGKMPDIAKRQRVLDLARSTVGVKDVVDELTLPKEE
jgi:osmotically-inducible protein OsmY